jgi:Rps23 Pro-64 3,4-dihydroxylase Tpa1-like proline 4-hydroxylase
MNINYRHNETFNLEKIRREYSADGIVSISNFLEETVADNLYTFLAETMPKDWWQIAVRYDDTMKYLSDTPENELEINFEYQSALYAFKRGTFSYFFRRTVGNHYSTCACLECSFRGFLNSQVMRDYLSKIGLSVTTAVEVFSSCYSPGDFLSPHHDKLKGSVGFVLNLSMNWRPQNGGNLYFLEEDWMTVRRVYTPEFNKLILFEVSGDGVPHFVSHTIHGKRLAISGWFQ